MIEPSRNEKRFAHKWHTDTGMGKAVLRQSGSKWNSEHMEALHVERFDNITIQRLFPGSLPSSRDPVFSRLRSELIACSFKDLKLGPTVVDERFEENLFCQFFKGLASAIMTGQAREGDEGDYEGDYEGDDASATTGSSEEEQPEVHSEAALQEFIGIIMKVIGPSIGPHWYMQVNKERMGTHIWLGNNPSTGPPKRAINDGGIVLSEIRQGRHRPGKTPVVSFEAKPRDLGSGRNYGSNEEEPYFAPGFAQEVAELLGQAFECTKEGQGRWGTHDGWLITLHGSRFRIINAYFDRPYLCQVSSPVLRSNKHLFVYRSGQFNLKYPDERIEALKATIALLRGLKSGAIQNNFLRNRIGK